MNSASRRGTSNTNDRGNTKDRERRREWLVQTWRADVDVVASTVHWAEPYSIELGKGVPACRCYRCGCLLTTATVTADRRVPGCQGGTYRRDNLRPACHGCNSRTGGALAHGKKAS